MDPTDLPRSRRVLLLVDVINPMDFPEAVDLAPHALQAAQATRRLRSQLGAEVPVIYANDNFGQWRSDFGARVPRVARGCGAGAQMAKALAPRRGDITVLKPKHSAFYGSPLDILLGHIGAREIVLAGVATDICVQMTAMDAFLRGYRIHVPSDCTAAETEEKKAMALRYMKEILRCRISPLKA
jgi:nicotinamidase-related amidase